jgi:hypothetical protein
MVYLLNPEKPPICGFLYLISAPPSYLYPRAPFPETREEVWYSIWRISLIMWGAGACAPSSGLGKSA